MAKATWEGAVIAESDDCIMVEGNHYFPADSVRMEFLEPTSRTTVCSWKGVANYYDILVKGRRNPERRLVLRRPLPAASKIQGRVAFWKGVQVE